MIERRDTKTKSKRGNGQGSLFKRLADGPWIGAWYDHGGERREKSTRTTDRAAALRMLGRIITDEELRRRGIIDPAAERIADHRKMKLSAHLADWQQAMSAGGSTRMGISSCPSPTPRGGLAGMSKPCCPT
ncbi:MAG: hypothetical protein WC058_15965 [Phycisphaeraceae bacterium]